MTADRECVILHDSKVDRTTIGPHTGPVWELTLAQVKELDCIPTTPHPAQPASHAALVPRTSSTTTIKIPTLTELLDSLPPPSAPEAGKGGGIELNMHTYPADDGRDLEPLVQAVCAEIRGRPGLLQTAFVAGDAAVMECVRAIDGRVRLCLLGRVASEHDRYIQKCAELGCDIMQPNWSIVSPQLCTRAHEAKIRVNPFWADEEEEMKRQLECGVDGMLTNYPALLIKVLRDAGLRGASL
jgi:glycerophosphoryl diester phosphodiesterase